MDLIRIIGELRQDRMAMVQHPTQYRCAFEACIEYARRLRSNSADCNDVTILSFISPNDSSGAANALKKDKRWKEVGKCRANMFYSLQEDGAGTPSLDILSDVCVHDEDRSSIAQSPPPLPPPRTVFGNAGMHGTSSPNTSATARDVSANSSSPGIASNTPSSALSASHTLTDASDISSASCLVVSKPYSDPSGSPEVRRKLGMAPIEKQAWFRSGVSREQMDELLEDAPEGMFAVRESTSKGCYALSVVHSGVIVHMLIVPVTVNGVTKFKLGRSSTETFSSVPELVQFFMENPYAVNPVTGEEFHLHGTHLQRKLSIESVV